jgi:hypothetical protein
MAKLGFAGGVFLYGVVVWAVLARRRSRRCWRINSAHLSFVLVASFSSAFGEVGAFGSGVRGWRLIVFQVMPPLPFFCLDAELSVGLWLLTGRI